MTRSRTFVACVIAGALAFGVAPRADAPHIYAISGARLITAAGAPIAAGTIVIRNGLIDAVGADVRPPADAMVIDGTGLQVYPGLIDMGNAAGLDAQPPAPPASFRTLEDAERFKRSVILRPELEAAKVLRPDAPELSRLAATGVTSVLATPNSGLFKGQSALVNVAAAVDEPQIGAVADPRKGLQIVRSPVALHVALGGGGRGAGYPVSLLGTIAFVRQSFLDAQHQQLEEQHYARTKSAVVRPTYDPSLDAIQPALARAVPVAFEAQLSREILRALSMAKEFNLDPVITGAREADQVVQDLKARNARVIYSLDFPVRSRALAPDADEPIRELRPARPGAEDARRAREGRAALCVLVGRASAAARFRPERGARRQGRPARRGCGARPDDQRGAYRRGRRSPRIAREGQDRQRHRHRRRSVRGAHEGRARLRRRPEGRPRAAGGSRGSRPRPRRRGGRTVT